MPDERSDVDAALARLDERIARLRAALPAPTPAPPLVLRRRSPRTTARTILGLFAVVAGFLLVRDVVEIFFTPDQHVFVGREGKEFHVWENVFAYEEDTGQKWIEQPRWTTELVATFHGPRRSQALAAVAYHVLFLTLSVVAFRAVGWLREDFRPEPGSAADLTGVGNELTAS
jgi:hypothetical protein